MEKDIAKLSKTLYENGNFSHNDVPGQEAMRNLFYHTLGVPVETKGSALFTAFQQNKYALFAVINQAIGAVLPTIANNAFNNLAEVHEIDTGDIKRFTIREKQLFPVSLVAAGTQNLKRHKLAGTSYTVDTDNYGIKVYTELEDFLTGKTDWADYVDSVALSLNNFIGERIYEAVELGYSGLRAKHKVQSGSTFDVGTIVKLARQVKASNGNAKVSIYATLGALTNIEGIDLSDNMRDEQNRNGYLTTVRGIDLFVLPDAVDLATDEFVVSDKTLLFIPGNEKIIDVVIEGRPITIEGESALRNDLQMEFTTIQRIGVHVKQAAQYGMYKLA